LHEYSGKSDQNEYLCKKVSVYVRNKQKQETDFLIVHEGTPRLLLETKLSDRSVDPHHFRTQEALGQIPLVQVCQEPGIASMQRRGVFRMSANRLFG
jgi:hypothetical protein